MTGVQGRSVIELEEVFVTLLRSAQPACPLSDLAGDGTARIPSLVSVWLISQVSAAVDQPKLVNLSRVDREELRSIGGVTRLIHRTLHPVAAEMSAA